MITPSLNLNVVTRLLAFGDSFVWSGYYLFNSIVALFLEDRIPLNPVRTIALGLSVYMITRTVLQIPASKLMDKFHSYKDEVYALIIGGAVMSFSYLGYELVSSEWHVYLINAMFGLGAAVYLPSWRKLYAKHIDDGKEGYDYAVADSMLTLSGGIAAAAGGFIVELTGSFLPVFILSMIVTLSGSLMLFKLIDEVG